MRFIFSIFLLKKNNKGSNLVSRKGTYHGTEIKHGKILAKKVNGFVIWTWFSPRLFALHRNTNASFQLHQLT